MFPVTTSLREALELLNRLPADKLGRILKRIVANLHSRTGAFDTDEEQQLGSILGLAPSELNTVLSVSSYVLEQAAFCACSGDALTEFLGSSGMAEPQAACFGAIWGSVEPEVTKRQKGFTIGAPLVLKDVEWQLRMNMAQSAVRNRKSCCATLQLSLGEAGTAPDEMPAEKLSVEFTHQELYEFFNKLETVQQQLDTFS